MVTVAFEQWLPITGLRGLMVQWHFLFHKVPGPVLHVCVLVGAVVQGPSLSLERSFVRCSVAACSASMHSGAATRHLATCQTSDRVTLNFGSVSTEVAVQWLPDSGS